MKAKELYPLIYQVVNRVIKNEVPHNGCEYMFEWAKRIPSPSKTSESLASALCTSVSHSKEIGLECFFQYKIGIAEIRDVLRPLNAFSKEEEVQFMNIAEIDPLLGPNTKLGYFVREFFDGRKGLNDDDYNDLKTI